MTTATPPELPATFVATRDALHHVAFFAMAPYRYDRVGRLGLRATPGGFGTTWIPSDDGPMRVSIQADQLTIESPSGRRSESVSTVDGACRFLGIEYRDVWFPDFHDPLAPDDPSQPLAVDPVATSALGEWFAFGTAALESLADVPNGEDVSAIQLWPEHFDPARDVGSQDAGSRASYGASAGDAGHPEPYLYISPWGDTPADPFWNDTSFGGASLGHAELLASTDPLALAVDFFWRGHVLLLG